MNDSFEIIDAPALLEVVSLVIEDCGGQRNYRRFAHFKWRDSDFWLLGTMVWRNTLQVGRVNLRLPRGRKIIPARITVHPDGALRFTIHRPRCRHCESARAFVFEGFSEQLLVNVDFVIDEHRRWSELRDKYRGAEPRIEKPPKGSFV